MNAAGLGRVRGGGGSGAGAQGTTLTEIPILQGLLGQGMGQGPALALLLAGPALSLPNLLVIRGVLGTRKTLAYAALVIVLSTLAGAGYGALVAGPTKCTRCSAPTAPARAPSRTS